VPADLDVHLVLDNYAIHKAPPVKAWLARHPRYHLHFTPTGASWLNQVERWFALLADKQITRAVHRSIHDLKARHRRIHSGQQCRPKALHLDQDC
jgi:transposase